MHCDSINPFPLECAINSFCIGFPELALASLNAVIESFATLSEILYIDESNGKSNFSQVTEILCSARILVKMFPPKSLPQQSRCVARPYRLQMKTQNTLGYVYGRGGKDGRGEPAAARLDTSPRGRVVSVFVCPGNEGAKERRREYLPPRGCVVGAADLVRAVKKDDDVGQKMKPQVVYSAACESRTSPDERDGGQGDSRLALRATEDVRRPPAHRCSSAWRRESVLNTSMHWGSSSTCPTGGTSGGP